MRFLVQWWLIGPAGSSTTLDAGRGDARVAGRVGEAQHGVGVGHVEVVAHQRHAEGRVQPFQQHRAQVGHAVAVGVAQQRDAVGAGHAGAGALHHQAHHPALDAPGRRRAWAGHWFRPPARRRWAARAASAGGPARWRTRPRARRPALRRLALRPALGGRDVHGGQRRFTGAGSVGCGRCRPTPAAWPVAAGGERSRRRGHHGDHQRDPRHGPLHRMLQCIDHGSGRPVHGFALRAGFGIHTPASSCHLCVATKRSVSART